MIVFRIMKYKIVELAFGLAVVLTLTSALAQERWFGEWVVTAVVDRFDDTESKLMTSAPLNYAERDMVALSLMCLEDGLNVVVYWGRYFAGDQNERVQVRYRFDDRAASDEQLWTMTGGNHAAWMPMHLVDEFVRTARSSRSILVRVVDPLDNDTIASETSLEGFSQALDAMLPCASLGVPPISRPDNDQFASARRIMGAAGHAEGNNQAATVEAAEAAQLPDSVGEALLWWRWTPTESGHVVFDTSGSTFDTVLSVFSGGRPGASGFTMVASNDDAVDLGTRSRVSWFAWSGTEYHIAVGGYRDARGDIVLNWSEQSSASVSAGQDPMVTVRACGSIEDNATGLEWFLGPDRDLGWSEARDLVNSLGACGKSWRLPSSEELLTLFNPALSAGTGYLTDGRRFPARIHPAFNAIGEGAWAWTDRPPDAAGAWAINLHLGSEVAIPASGAPYSTRLLAVHAAAVEESVSQEARPSSPPTAAGTPVAAAQTAVQDCVTQTSGSCSVSFGAWTVKVAHPDGERRVTVAGRPPSKTHAGAWFRPDYDAFGHKVGDFVLECRGSSLTAYAVIAQTLPASRIDAEWRFSSSGQGASASWSRSPYRVQVPTSQIATLLREAQAATSGNLTISLMGIRSESISIPVAGLQNAIGALHCSP